ncbi:MAG: PD-(D/E)XK motif protein [Prevotellaceae bacterium]|jgi:hypothetical protein|nr:PD-(D/E)XK motif protein [Prevotellaceae bacterium]
MDVSIYATFSKLQHRNSVSEYLCVASLPFSKNHKIGISSDKYPMFFIECEPTGFTIDTKLEFISVLFNRQCQLLEDNENTPRKVENTYTIIELKSGNDDLQQYFIEVVSLVIETLPKNPTHLALKTEIQKLITLFSCFNKPPRKQIQGLWAELFVIEQAKYPEYLIQSWHSSPDDKFDFNDGQDKIEVKSTAQSRRAHEFSIGQLNPNKNANLLIASVFVVNTGSGTNIFDLVKSICSKVSNPTLKFKLNDIIGQTVGQDFEKISSLYFDYQQALDTLAFYDFRDIPTVNVSNVPDGVSNVRFISDLSTITSIKHPLFDVSKSPLFKSIQI